MKNKPTQIGVTGGIGSGKSTVCHIFEILGCPVYDSDSRAKNLMVEDVEVVGQVKALIGESAYAADGRLNRQAIADKAFHDASILKKLNAIVHPAVRLDFSHWVNQQQAKVVVREAALLIESGAYHDLDSLVLVTAPQHVKVERVIKRDPHRSEKDVLAIIEKQLSDEEKRPFVHHEVINDGKASLIRQVLHIYDKVS